MQPKAVCTGTPHPDPNTLAEVFPPIARHEDLHRAVCAVEAACGPCMAADHQKARQDAQLPLTALAIFLMYIGLLAHEHDRRVGDTAHSMVKALLPDTDKVLAMPLVSVLHLLPVKEVPAPPEAGGGLVAEWEVDELSGLLHELSPDFRQEVWANTVGLLTGIARGEAERRKGAAS